MTLWVKHGKPVLHHDLFPSPYTGDGKNAEIRVIIPFWYIFCQGPSLDVEKSLPDSYRASAKAWMAVAA